MKVQQTLRSICHKSEVFLKNNGATILTCVGAVGVVATAVTAVKATPKAIQKMEELKREKGEELTKFEVVKTVAPVYIPAAVIGVSTIACMFGANALNKKQQAALMSAYALLDSSYKDYKNKMGELYGEAADIRVREEIAKDKYEEEDIEVDDGKQLFYDEFSKRYFESTMEDVISAEYKINRKLSTFYGAYLNEFYEHLGIEPVDYGDYLGWSIDSIYDHTWESWLDFYHEKVVMEDGLECYIITMSVDPSPDFDPE